MCEKIKLDKRTADAIEHFRGEGKTNKDILGISTSFNADGSLNDHIHVLALTDFDDLARALYIGYEVEPEFKAGDWVSVSWQNKKPTIHKVVKLAGGNDLKIDGEQLNKHPSLDIVRHATPKEIAKEKRRRWWTRHDRGVWELREGDALKADDGDYLVEVCEVFDSCNVRLTGGVTHVKVSELKEGYRVICFAEDRKDA